MRLRGLTSDPRRGRALCTGGVWFLPDSRLSGGLFCPEVSHGLEYAPVGVGTVISYGEVTVHPTDVCPWEVRTLDDE